MPPSTEPAVWQRRPATSAEIRADMLLAVGLFCLSILTLALFQAMDLFDEPASPAVSLACLGLATLPLALRRQHPTTVAATVALGVVLIGELAVPENLIRDIALFLAIYTLGAWGRNRRRARLVRALIVALMGLWLLTSIFRATLDPETAADLGVGELTPALASMLIQLVINILYFAAAILFGNLAWERARTGARLQQQAEQLRAERAVITEQAVALERMRIARELHDSVAHHVSLMGVQAGAARTVMGHDAAQAETFIQHIEESARRAVAELRSLLGVLRSDGAHHPSEDSATSSLGVDQIEDLVAASQATGLTVEYTRLGPHQPLRPLVSLCLYRIAQEALTNVRKHAGPTSHTRIVLRYQADSVELEVSDDGAGRRHRPPVSSTSAASGHGIIGMRERIEALQGRLTVEPHSPTGFLLRADLPLQPQQPPAPISGDRPILTGTQEQSQ